MVNRLILASHNPPKSDVSVICRVIYFQFPIQSAFLPYIGRQAAPALRCTINFNTKYRTSDVAENLRRCVSCTECTVQGKRVWINILTVECQFGGVFPAICNHCGVLTAWIHKTWKFCEKFLPFLGEKPLWKNFQNYVTKVFTASSIDFCWKFSLPHQLTLFSW